MVNIFISVKIQPLLSVFAAQAVCLKHEGNEYFEGARKRREEWRNHVDMQ